MKLTTNHPETNVASALNLFYVKDDETFVRGYGKNGSDISLNEWTKEMIEKHKLPIGTKDAHDMGCDLVDYLDEGTDTVAGLVALLYTVGWAFSELRAKLEEYENINENPEELTEFLMNETEYFDGDKE